MVHKINEDRRSDVLARKAAWQKDGGQPLATEDGEAHTAHGL